MTTRESVWVFALGLVTVLVLVFGGAELWGYVADGQWAPLSAFFAERPGCQ